jgi:hypothetical protein
LGCSITAIITRDKRAALMSNKKTIHALCYFIHNYLYHVCSKIFFLTDGSIYAYECVIDFVKVNFKLLNLETVVTRTTMWGLIEGTGLFSIRLLTKHMVHLQRYFRLSLPSVVRVECPMWLSSLCSQVYARQP